MKKLKTLIFGAIFCANVIVGAQALATTNEPGWCIWTLCLSDGSGCEYLIW